MATSPYFSTSNQYILYDIHVDELSTDIATNTSRVRVYVLAWRTNTGYTTDGDGTCYVNINGSDYANSWSYGDGHAISYDSDTVLFDTTVTIPHDADGKKTIYVSAYISHARFSSNSQGFNVTLTAIPRQANITGAPNFNDTQNPTITYSNPAGNAVTSLQACISLTGASADIPYRDISKTGTSYTFNLSQAERNTLLSSIPNSNSRTVIFYVKSVIGGVTYYSTLTRTLSVVNANPTISGASYYDTNSATIAITGNNQKIIQKTSNVTFKFNTLSALKYATLSNIKVTCNGITKTASLSGSTASNITIAFGAIDSSSNLSAAIELTDSRGNKANTSLTITMLEWSLPTAAISLSRKSNYYSESYLTVNANISSLDGQNTVTIQYQYKEKSAGSYGSLVTINNGQTYTLNLDNEKSYDFKIFVTDRVGETIYNKVLQIGIPILYIDRLKRSVGVGTIPSEYNMFAADRRIQLKNPLQETLLDLWTTVETYANRSAFLRIYNTSGQHIIELNGYDGGTLRLKSYDNIEKVLLNAPTGSNSGGELILRNNDAKTGIYTYAGSNGGIFGLYNSTNDIRVIYMDTTSTGGRIWVLDTSNNVNISLTGSSGNITCVSLTQTSSRKVKKNVEELTPEEAYKVLELTAITFDYISSNLGTDRRGFIAEDVAEIIPSIVTPETEETPASLDYIQLIPYLQTVIKNQEQRIKNQEQRIKDLESRLADLEKKLDSK